MKHAIVSCLAVAIMLLSRPPLLGGADKRGIKYEGIPEGKRFDFPASPEVLAKMRRQSNVTGIRKHAWRLFGGLTKKVQGGDGPVWETWYTRCEVFQYPCSDTEHAKCSATQRAPLFELEEPLQLFPLSSTSPKSGPLTNVNVFNVGDSLIDMRLFNREACEHIRDSENPLWDEKTLKALNDYFQAHSRPVAQREIPSFPANAMALKTMWRIIQPDGTRTVKIWDPTSAGGPWKSVRIDISNPKGNRCVPPSSENVVPVSCFYYVAVTPENVEQIHGNTDLPIDQIQNVKVGAFAILLGMHVITREIPDWVWATFWWSDKPKWGPYARGRPAYIRGVWQNYLMDTTLDQITPREHDGTANICFNPYLEGFDPAGRVSNCMQCHRRAVYGGRADATFDALRREILADDPYFSINGPTLKLDFIWSFTDEVLDLMNAARPASK
ncbi:MAG: hypothetical protein ACLQOO_02190 [Terriglobia bacterium]